MSTFLTSLELITQVLGDLVNANLNNTDPNKPVLPVEIQIGADVAGVLFPQLAPVIAILQMLASSQLGADAITGGENLIKKILAAEINHATGQTKWSLDQFNPPQFGDEESVWHVKDKN